MKREKPGMRHNLRGKGKETIIGVATILALATISGISAYKTHSEIDSHLFFREYPHLLETRLDSCEACHLSIMAPPPGDRNGRAVKLSACDSCHVKTDYGREMSNTLNAYGLDYLKAGRNPGAFSIIAKLDSDGDGWSNDDELKAVTNPGDSESMPGMKPAPHAVVSFDELIGKNVPVRQQTIFVNVSKSRDGDSYSSLRGFRLIDVLEAAGISDAAKSVDVISLDGYMATFSIDQLRRSYPQAPPALGLDKETLGECGWVRYGAGNLREDVPLPDADILLTFEVNGENYSPASMNDQGRLVGNGPFRLIAPQMENPGIPDISSQSTDTCKAMVPEKFHYNRDYEKNADYCVKAVTAIRVNPLPPGTLDIHWPHYAGNAIAEKNIVIFGALTDGRK
jgi:hypothetical protein